MENQNNKADCGCGTDCCTPPKNNTVKYIILALVVFAVAAIVTAKFASQNENKTKTGSDSTVINKPACCDTSANNTLNVADSAGKKSCCPQAK